MSVIDTVKSQIKTISLEDMQTITALFTDEANRRYAADKKFRAEVENAQFAAKMEKSHAFAQRINKTAFDQFNRGR